MTINKILLAGSSVANIALAIILIFVIVHRGKVFISHARESRQVAINCKQLFAALGVDSFVDFDMAAGEAWRQRIDNELRGCDSVVLLWDVHASESTYVKQELEVAIRYGKPIIAIAIRGDTTPMPEWLSNYQVLRAHAEADE